MLHVVQLLRASLRRRVARLPPSRRERRRVVSMSTDSDDDLGFPDPTDDKEEIKAPAGEEEGAAPPAVDAPEAEAKTEEAAAEAEKPESDEEDQMTETSGAGSKRQREEPEDTAVAGDGDGEISGECSYAVSYHISFCVICRAEHFMCVR